MSATWDYELPSGHLVQLTVPGMQSLDGLQDSDVVRSPDALQALGVERAYDAMEVAVDRVIVLAVVQPAILPTPLDWHGQPDPEAIQPEGVYVHDLALHDKLLILQEIDRHNREVNHV